MKLNDLDVKIPDFSYPKELIDNPDFYKQKIEYIQDLMMTNPGVNDAHLTQEWLADFRSHAIELVTIYGKLNANYTRFAVQLLKSLSTEDFKKYCKSEQMTKDYTAAHFPYTEELFMLKPLVEKYFPQVSSEYITLISASKKQNTI